MIKIYAFNSRRHHRHPDLFDKWRKMTLCYTHLYFTQELKYPTDTRMFVLAAALKAGYEIDRLYELTKIDKWFLHKMRNMINYQVRMECLGPKQLTKELVMEGKQLGFSDKQIAICVKSTELAVRNSREEFGTHK